jgi:uncharacterized delta-60 repeat protein
VTGNVSRNESAYGRRIVRPLASTFCAVLALASSALAAAPGDRDRGFGVAGRVTTDFGGSERASAVALQSDRKIVVVGASTSPSPVPADDFFIARYTQTGAPDSGFGSGGKVRTDFGGSFERAWAALVQADGKIVVAGDGSAAGSQTLDFVLARYNGDGTLDGGFGTGGKVVTTFEPDSLDTGQAAVLQPDGKIVVAGRTRKIGVGGSLALARYLPDGRLDASFGGDGLVVTQVTPTMIPAALALQPDGKLISGGWNGQTSVIVRHNSDGSLDLSFDGDGVLIGAAGLSIARDVALQPDGRILVADGSVVRLNTDGSLDSTFGTGGTARPAMVDAEALAVQADGEILVSGTFYTATDGDFAVARLTSTGQPDPRFRRGGANTVDIGSRSQDEVTDAVLQPDGKLVVSGATRPTPGSGDWDFAVARYTVVVPCVVPNVKGKTLAAARAALVRSRCTLGTVRRARSTTVKKGRVISQRPRPGARVKELAKVSVVVSRGKRRQNAS